MKYAKEVIDLMAAFPGRDFRMMEIIKTISGKSPEEKERNRVRRGVRIVLLTLIESGHVILRPAIKLRGGYALYRWKK